MTPYLLNFLEGHSRAEQPYMRKIVDLLQGFRQFCKVADMFVEAPDVIYLWCRKAPFERLKRELPRGVLGHAPPGNF